MKRLPFLLFLLLLGTSLWAQEKPQTAKEYQDQLNKEFANREESPLTEEDFKTFKALDFYPISDTYIVTATFTRTPKEKVFKMKTSTARLPKYVKYGVATFTLEGKTYSLNVYQNIDLIKQAGYEDYLFLPFSDLTCGNGSYIGGRYLDMRIPKDNQLTIDFNKAYNPYCAYNHNYSCPKVPLENELPVAIPAGVKQYHE